MRRTAVLVAFLVLMGWSSAAANPFAGVWRAQTTLMNMPAFVELVMQPNFSFTQQTTVGGTLITIMGTYRVLAEQNVLRLDIQNYEPKQWCGPLGCSPIYMPAGETHYFHFASPTAMSLQPADGNSPPITYSRAF